MVPLPESGDARKPDGQPNLTAPAPRKAGKPDFWGIWRIAPPRTIPTAEGSYASLDYWMADGEKISMQSAAQAMYEKRFATFGAGLRNAAYRTEFLTP